MVLCRKGRAAGGANTCADCANAIFRVLYLRNRDQGFYLDTTRGLWPVDTLTVVALNEGSASFLPLCLQLRLLHAWRYVLRYDDQKQ